MAGTTRVAVWDLPIRLFHWVLVGLIGFSFYAVKSGHVDWHIYSGFAILSLLIFRLLWGVVGSSTARFANFVRGPSTVLAYLRGSSGWKGAGHTPLGALSVLALLGALLVQVGLGLFAVDGDGLNEGPLAHFISVDSSDRMRGLHEAWFTIVLAMIVLHLGAILFYRLFRKQKLTSAMITGSDDLDPQAVPIRPGKYWVALICLIAGIALTRWIIAGVPPFGG
ncbi:MAG: cytochrome b/b6 domain-containing protein [Pseudomonadota bacterium]